MKAVAFLVAAFATTGAVADNPTLAVTQVEEAFVKADKNKNGTVEMAEAKRFGISQVAFTKANPDKDGSLDKEEFAKAVSLQFDIANPDKDGTLDQKEARKAGVKSKAAFEGANPDKDGTLDIQEFLKALTTAAK